MFVEYNLGKLELTERDIEISTSRMGGHGTKVLVASPEGLSTDPTPSSSQTFGGER